MRPCRAGRAARTALVAGCVVLLAGCSGSTSKAGTPAPSTPAVSASQLSSATGEPVAGPQPLPVSTVSATSLSIPAIGVRASLDRLVRQRNGELQRPPAWLKPGWYAGGPVPGDQGPAVIAGHVDSPNGPAVFWRLRELAPGDEIVVARSDGTSATFSVTRTQQFSQAAFPTDLVYGPTPSRELRLITCGGTYDHQARRYRDNVVVFAVAEDEPA